MTHVWWWRSVLGERKSGVPDAKSALAALLRAFAAGELPTAEEVAVELAAIDAQLEQDRQARAAQAKVDAENRERRRKELALEIDEMWAGFDSLVDREDLTNLERAALVSIGRRIGARPRD